MSKVRLTQEQADAIEELMQAPFNNTKDGLLVEHTTLGGFTNLNKAGVDIPLLAKALYIGYEVEPEFEKGQWIIELEQQNKSYREARKEIEFLWNREYKRNANEYEVGRLDGLDIAMNIIDEVLEASE